jgi:hypothetical protein
MTPLEHFFKGLTLYLEARIWIQIRIKVKSEYASASNISQHLDPHEGDKSNSQH